MHRCGVAVLHCDATSTEVQGCLVGVSRLHSERKQPLLLSRDTVAFRYVSSLNILFNRRVVNQPQTLPCILPVPVHGVVAQSLFTLQGHIPSSLSEHESHLVDFSIHGSCGVKTQTSRREPDTIVRRGCWSGDLHLQDQILLSGCWAHLLPEDKGPRSRRSSYPWQGLGICKAPDTDSERGQGKGLGSRAPPGSMCRIGNCYKVTDCHG